MRGKLAAPGQTHPDSNIGCQTQTRRATLGHSTTLRVFIDLDLLQFDEVWAAAGIWHDVCGIEPRRLVEASGGVVTDVKRG